MAADARRGAAADDLTVCDMPHSPRRPANFHKRPAQPAFRRSTQCRRTTASRTQRATDRDPPGLSHHRECPGGYRIFGQATERCSARQTVLRATLVERPTLRAAVSSAHRWNRRITTGGPTDAIERQRWPGRFRVSLPRSAGRQMRKQNPVTTILSHKPRASCQPAGVSRGRDGPSPYGLGRPPHRSQRAGLPHWAPTLGVRRRSGPPGKGAARGPGVAIGRDAVHPLPGEPVSLAAAPQRPEPEALHLIVEGRWRIVSWDGVVGEMASQHTRQPPPLIGDG
jgi:hypothetical protein